MTFPTSSYPARTVNFAAVALLRENARHTTAHIVARAARRHGATADAYRISAEGLDSQADRAATLLFGEAASAALVALGVSVEGL